MGNEGFVVFDDNLLYYPLEKMGVASHPTERRLEAWHFIGFYMKDREVRESGRKGGQDRGTRKGEILVGEEGVARGEKEERTRVKLGHLKRLN